MNVETEQWKERLQEAMDNDALPDNDTLRAVEEEPELAAYWSALLRLRAEFRSDLDEAIVDQPALLQPGPAGRSLPGGWIQRLVNAGKRPVVLAAAALLLFAVAGIAAYGAARANRTRNLVRQEVAAMVNDLYAPDAPGLGTIEVPLAKNTGPATGHTAPAARQR